MERVKSIDISKGISIILMTFSHLLVIKKYPVLSDVNIEYLMIFKMPLFIIISGILYNNKRSLKDFIFSKVDSLVKPTISAIVLFCGILFLISLLYFGTVNLREILAQTILFIFPLWFIFSLFFSLCILRFIFFMAENRDHATKFAVITATILVLSVLNIYSLRYYLINLSTVVYFVLYLLIGYTIKKEQLLKYLISNKVFATSVLFFITFVFLTQTKEIKLSLTNNVFEPFFVTLIYSVIGSIIILNISNMIAKKTLLAKVFILCGQNSFFILSFHIALGNFIIPMLLPAYDSNYMLDFMVVVCTIFGCILIKTIFEKINITRYLFLPVLNKKI